MLWRGRSAHNGLVDAHLCRAGHEKHERSGAHIHGHLQCQSGRKWEQFLARPLRHLVGWDHHLRLANGTEKLVHALDLLQRLLLSPVQRVLRCQRLFESGPPLHSGAQDPELGHGRLLLRLH